MRPSYDVVVVGARCAGAGTALLLARRGLRVLVVDRARRGSDTLSTHALMRPAVVQLHRWGLLDEVVAAGTPAVTRTTFHYGEEESVGITLRPVAGTDALYAPRRTVLDPILLDAAERAGADVVTGVGVRGLLRADDGRVTGVRLRDGRTVTARLTVGADGLRSLVADQVGAAVERTGATAGTATYGYLDDLPTDGYEWFYGSGATAGFLPTNGGQTLAFLVHPAGGGPHPVEPGPDGFARAMRTAWPDGGARLERARLASTLRRFSGLPSFRRQAWGPGWALVGDAGYYIDPMSSHGISQALRDAELLADAVTSGAPLAEFQWRRDALTEGIFDTVERIASFRWDLAEVRDLLLELSSGMSDEVDALVALDEAATALTA